MQSFINIPDEETGASPCEFNMKFNFDPYANWIIFKKKPDNMRNIKYSCFMT